jgi:hypothetical protein
VPHDGERARDARAHERRLGGLAGAGEIPRHAVAHAAGLQFDQRRPVAGGRMLANIRAGRHRQRSGEAGGGQQDHLDVRREQHGDASQR